MKYKILKTTSAIIISFSLTGCFDKYQNAEATYEIIIMCNNNHKKIEERAEDTQYCEKAVNAWENNFTQEQKDMKEKIKGKLEIKEKY